MQEKKVCLVIGAGAGIGVNVAKKFAAESCNSIEELLKASDFVSLHCPSTKETKGLIDLDLLSKMKKSNNHIIYLILLQA